MRRSMLAPVGAVVVLATVSALGLYESDSKGGPESLHELTTSEQIQIEQAELLLIKKCMAGHGFRYWVDPPVNAEDRYVFGFVIDDVVWARRHGYGGLIQRDIELAKKNDPNLTYRAGLSTTEQRRYTAALGGSPSVGMLSVEIPSGGTIRTPRGGCQAEAQEDLYGDRETWFRVENIVTNLTPLYVPDLIQDGRFIVALTEWASCMSRRGHLYGSPDEVRSELPQLTGGLSPAEAHTVEVELAVAEAICARESALADTARALEIEYGEEVRGRYAEEVATYRRMQHTALAVAREILISSRID